MNDLISRKALLAEYDRVHIGEPGKARKLIADAPAVDAVEVVHGRWTTRTVANWLYEEACSICGFCGCEEFNYCPNCGADMRERKEDGK